MCFIERYWLDILDLVSVWDLLQRKFLGREVILFGYTLQDRKFIEYSKILEYRSKTYIDILFYIVATHLINFVEDQGTIEIRDLCVPNSKRLDDLDVELPCPIFQRTIINDILSIFRNQHLMFQFHVFTRIRRNWDPIRR